MSNYKVRILRKNSAQGKRKRIFFDLSFPCMKQVLLPIRKAPLVEFLQERYEEQNYKTQETPQIKFWLYSYIKFRRESFFSSAISELLWDLERWSVRDPLTTKLWRLVQRKLTSGHEFLTQFLKQEISEDTFRIDQDPIIDRKSDALTGVFRHLPIGRYLIIPIFESLYNEKTKRSYSSG